jgi:hypothetical protein
MVEELKRVEGGGWRVNLEVDVLSDCTRLYVTVSD